MAWSCTSCQHENLGEALVCDSCGIARRWQEDPPLDIPSSPPWHHVGAAWAAAGYGGLAVAGVLVLLVPAWLETLGVAAHWVLLEVGVTGAAFVSALIEAVWRRNFNRAELNAAQTVRIGQEFEATLTLVPYRTLENVSVDLELVDRYFVKVVRDGKRQSSARSHVVERHRMQLRTPLTGRREHMYVARMFAPVPTASQSDVQSEIMASVLAMFGPFVPGLGHYARNLREHGGFFVRAVVRFGIWRRVYERRVVAVMVPVARS